MKRLLAILTLSILLTPAVAQEVKMVYDEECGCDLRFVEGIQTTREGDLYGFRLEDGTQIVPNMYRYVGEFTGGYCRVMPDEYHCGIVDSTGRLVVPCLYDDVGYPTEGRVAVVRNGRYGYCDFNGNLVIPIQYLVAGDFNEGWAPVMVAVDSFYSACTFIDTMGRMLSAPEYDNVQPFNCGYALVRKYDRWGAIDHSGRYVLPTMFENMTTFFGDTLCFAGSPEGMALYDKRMKPLTEEVYTWTGGLSDGRISVKRGDKYGFLDCRGHEVIPCIYDLVSPFSLGRAMVQQGSRYGIIDTMGRFVLPLEYDYTSYIGDRYIYHDSLALVEKDGHVGFVDLDGNLAIPMYFEQAYHFSEGLACAKYNGMWGYIDTHGDVFMPFIFDLASPYKWGRAEVLYQGELRNVDRRGRCVGNCKGIIAWRKWTE